VDLARPKDPVTGAFNLSRGRASFREDVWVWKTA
jgi:hypothetical protein